VAGRKQGSVNRRERRAKAREALSGQGFKGVKKQQAVRELAKAFTTMPVPDDNGTERELAADKRFRFNRRKSGIVVARDRQHS
jgi:hypothetical protein